MSTATVDSPETTRRPSAASKGPRALEDSRRDLVEVRQHTEAAVTDLVTATTDALRAFVPAAVLHPTEAIEHAFDVAEQVLAATRRVCVEVASVLESGLQGVERRSA